MFAELEKEHAESILSCGLDEVPTLIGAMKSNAALMDGFAPKEKASNITEFEWKNMKYP